MPDIAIQVRGLGKRYALGGRRRPYKTLRESLVQAVTGPFRRTAAAADPAGPTSFWALRDVNFTVNRGEVVGIIGRNGAGKSTLLKVLSRITDPTEGQIQIDGRVGSLLEVGTGFHPELTGRENVYLNGAILGMRRAEITRKFDEIVAFAETEKFLDTPVKFYSSGMYTRLAFAVAAHLDPEVLIVDEVLAVGDAAFQKKCLGKMGEVARHGRTVLFVSHNISAVQTLCTRSVWLDAGHVRTAGQTGDVVDAYQRATADVFRDAVDHRADRAGTGTARCTSVVVRDQHLAPTSSVPPGDPFYIDLGFVVRERARNVLVAVGINAQDGTRVVTLYSRLSDDSFDVQAGQATFRCAVAGLPVRPDTYTIETFIGQADETFDNVVGAAELEVRDRPFYSSGRFPDRSQGPLLVHHAWTAVGGPVIPA